MGTKSNKAVLTGLPEKFVHLGNKGLDTKNRISLGGKIADLVFNQTGADNFQIFYGEDGDILLRPILAVPVKEVWLYQNPEAFGKIRQGLIEAKAGKSKKVTKLPNFLKKL